MQMFVFPVNTEAELPPAFVENIQIPEQPANALAGADRPEPRGIGSTPGTDTVPGLTLLSITINFIVVASEAKQSNKSKTCEFD